MPVTADLVALCTDYRYERDQVPQAADSPMVFVNLFRPPLGRPMLYPSTREASGRLARAAGRACRPHMLRHSAATRWLRDGVDGDVVQRLLGHASPLSVENHRHVDAAEARAAVEHVNWPRERSGLPFPWHRPCPARPTLSRPRTTRDGRDGCRSAPTRAGGPRSGSNRCGCSPEIGKSRVRRCRCAGPRHPRRWCHRRTASARCANARRSSRLCPTKSPHGLSCRSARGCTSARKRNRARWHGTGSDACAPPAAGACAPFTTRSSTPTPCGAKPVTGALWPPLQRCPAVPGTGLSAAGRLHPGPVPSPHSQVPGAPPHRPRHSTR
ncbi:tyrosine-type recombinase/integrase [Streptomyces sp. NPDC051136]|uniref:tyrosine-type recombinase/integrase n=1 Tax=Streptomyces sp. NPDC051136 TaxID=3365643 RepID=UPI0037BD8883